MRTKVMTIQLDLLDMDSTKLGVMTRHNFDLAVIDDEVLNKVLEALGYDEEARKKAFSDIREKVQEGRKSKPEPEPEAAKKPWWKR